LNLGRAGRAALADGTQLVMSFRRDALPNMQKIEWINGGWLASLLG